MKISAKLNVLRQINKIYDDFINGFDLACDRLCAHCCTRNVTMTTLEGYNIMKYLETSNQGELLKKVKKDAERLRYIPLITTNQIAQMGYEGKEIPEEAPGEAEGVCPVLENDECLIYEVRPFGCRCLVSKHNCKDKGYAEINPFVITVNNIFFQFLEHVDENGFFGNFTDVLLFLGTKDDLSYKETDISDQVNSKLLKNYRLSVLLIPPEHREQIKPILELLQNIKVPKEI